MVDVSTAKQQAEPRRSLNRPSFTLQGFSLTSLVMLSTMMLFWAFFYHLNIRYNPIEPMFEYINMGEVANKTANAGAHKDGMNLLRGGQVLPPLASVRNIHGEWEFKDRHDAPILYGMMHAVPATIWSISMPLQHIQRLRTKYPRIHRISGYITLTCSFLLALSGLLMPRRKLAFTHPDYFHVHTLRIGGIPILAWPGFHLQCDLIGLAVLFTAYKTVVSARQRDYATHRAWAQAHTYVGYIVPMQRVWMAILMLIALALPRLPERVLRMVDYPTTDKGIHETELSGFAGSVMVATASIMFVGWQDYRSRHIKQL